MAKCLLEHVPAEKKALCAGKGQELLIEEWFDYVKCFGIVLLILYN